VNHRETPNVVTWPVADETNPIWVNGIDNTNDEAWSILLGNEEEEKSKKIEIYTDAV
jgi:hypothetical protein